MTQTTDLKAIADALRQHDRFLVVTHENPDGDALGSLLAATLALRQLGKDVVMYLAGETPLPREYCVHAARRARTPAAGGRVGARAARRRLRQGGPDRRPGRSRGAPRSSSNVDHHHDNTRFGDVNLIVADASSTGEVLRDVFAELGVELTPELAEPLYIALVTDTGRFQYANTTPKALRLAAELVDAGADIHAVFQQVYESVEFAKLKLLARALDRAEVLEGGRIVVSHLVRGRLRGGGCCRAVLGGDHRLPARGRRGRAGCADPRAAEPRGAGAKGLAPLEHRRARRLGDRAALRRRRASPGSRLLHAISRWRDRRADPPRLPRATCRRARLSRRASRS